MTYQKVKGLKLILSFFNKSTKYCNNWDRARIISKIHSPIGKCLLSLKLPNIVDSNLNYFILCQFYEEQTTMTK